MKKIAIKKSLLALMIFVFGLFTIPINGLAETKLPEKITNIYELRSESKITTSNRRIVGGNAETYGYYLGSNEQFLPYKVANANTGSIVGDYKGENVSGGVAIYCTLFGEKSPANNSFLNITEGNFNQIANGTAQGVTCTKANTANGWDDAIRAGVGAIIASTNGSDLASYYKAEIAINQFLYEKTSNQLNHTNNSQTSLNTITSYDQNSVNLAKAAYDKYKTGIKITEPNSSEMVYSNGIFKSKEYISATGQKYANTKKVIIKNSKGEQVYNGYGYVATTEHGQQIGVCNDGNANEECKKISNFKKMAPGEYTVIATIEYETEKFPMASNYSCGNGYQTITPAATEPESITNSVTKTFNFTVPEEEQKEENDCKITIYKKGVIGEKKVPIGGAKFEITDPSGNKTQHTVPESGKLIISSLECGKKYTIKETKAPDGYVIDKENYEVTTDKENNELTVYNNYVVKDNKGTIIIEKMGIKGKSIAPIGGAQFEITDPSGNKTQHTVPESGELLLDSLSYGKYTIKETKAPDGYLIDKENYELEISKSNPNQSLTVNNNYKITSTVTVKKVDKKGNPVEGATLRLLDENGEKVVDDWKTTKEAKVIPVKPGKYTLEEVSAPKGYALSKDKIEFEITDVDEKENIEFINDELVPVPNTLSTASKLLIIAGVIGMLAGGYLIYSNEKKGSQV